MKLLTTLCRRIGLVEAKRIDEAEIAAILGYPAENREALGSALGFDGMLAQSFGRADLENVTEAQLLLARDIVCEAYATAHYGGAQHDFTCGVGATIVRLYRNRANRPPPRPRRPPPSGPVLSDAELNRKIAAMTTANEKRMRACQHCPQCGSQGLNLDGSCPRCIARWAAAAEPEAVVK